MTTAPTIETDRLTLRAACRDDWDAYYALMSSDRAKHMGGPFSTDAAWGWFCHDIAQWSIMGHGGLMIEDRASGQCLGQVGINHGPLFPERELGWLIYPDAEGHGFAFEAASAYRDWAWDQRDYPTLVSYISPNNIRSKALATRLGANLDPKAPQPHVNDLVYRHFSR